MTLNTTVSRVKYPGAGLVGPFVIPFRFFAAADLVVTRESAGGIDSTLLYATDFTLTGIADATGNLTLTVALAVGETLVIRRAPVLTQPTSIRNQGSYFPGTIEDMIDRMVMQIQSLDDRLSRAFGVTEIFDPATLTLLLRPETGKVLGWDSSTVLTNKTLDSSAVALPGAGRTVATLSAFLANNAVYNIKDYGCVGNDIADDTANYRNTVTNVPSGGGLLYMPSPPVAYKLNGTITLKTGITVQGTGRDCCQIKQYANVDTFFASSALGCREIVMRDFFINDAVAPVSRTAGSGINLDGTGDAVTAVLERIFCNGHFDGVKITRCLTSSLRDIRCNIQRHDSFSFYGACSTTTVSSCYADAPIRHGYYWDGGAQYMHMVNLACDVQGGDAYHVDAVPATNYCSFLTFTSCGSEGGTGSCYYFREGSGHSVISPKFTGNNVANQHGLWADGAKRITVIGGQWFFLGGFGVKTTISATPTTPDEIVLIGNDFNNCALGLISDPVGAVTRWQGKTFSVGYSTGTPTTATLYGRLTSITGLAANVGAGETTLFSYLIPANTLVNNGQAIHARGSGFTAGNATAKRIRVYLGATLIADSGAGGLNAGNWSFDIEIVRDAHASHFVNGSIGGNQAVLPLGAVYAFAPQDETTALLLKVTGLGGVDNDVVQRDMTVKYAA